MFGKCLSFIFVRQCVETLVKSMLCSVPLRMLLINCESNARLVLHSFIDWFIGEFSTRQSCSIQKTFVREWVTYARDFQTCITYS